MSKPNESAFPMMPSHTNPADVDKAFTGLTKREYMATQLMQGMLAHPDLMRGIADRTGGDTAESLRIAAQGAVMHADALLAELSKTEAK